MATNTTKPHRTLVAGKIPMAIPAAISYTHALIAALTGNVHVTSPNPPIASLTDLVNKLEAAETATKTRAKGTIEARNAAMSALKSALEAERATIQLVADSDPDNAPAIITSTSLSVRKVGSHGKAPFAVRQGDTSGSVRLAVKSAGPHSAYDWEWSADGGKTWTAAASTTQAKTVVASLPVGTSLQFRFRAVTPKGEGDWSQPLSFLVK
jgi:hypothetical protein